MLIVGSSWTEWLSPFGTSVKLNYLWLIRGKSGGGYLTEAAIFIDFKLRLARLWTRNLAAAIVFVNLLALDLDLVFSMLLQLISFVCIE